MPGKRDLRQSEAVGSFEKQVSRAPMGLDTPLAPTAFDGLFEPDSR
jgi:hypothetical protein